MEKKERKERKEKEKDRAHPLVFDPIPEEEEDLVRTDGCSTTPSFTSGLRSGRAKTSPVVFHRETCPLACFLPPFLCRSLSLSLLYPSPPLSHARLPWKREAGGRGLDKFLASNERL